MTALAFDPGRLRHRVTIESAAGSPDGAGGEAVTWDSLATLWARVAPATGDERIAGGHVGGVVTHTITMRFRPDVAGGMRIVYRGRVFRVLVAFDPDEMQRYTTAKVEERRS